MLSCLAGVYLGLFNNPQQAGQIFPLYVLHAALLAGYNALIKCFAAWFCTASLLAVLY